MFRLFQRLIFLSLFLSAGLVRAQSIAVGDCFAAIPICGSTYEQTNSFSGEGLSPLEINPDPGYSCLANGEQNGVWYVFNVSSGGTLRFTIAPNNPLEDYNWQLFNLTSGQCDQIGSNANLSVSCNFSTTVGITGTDDGSPFNSQDADGIPFNASLNVQAGETYVLYIGTPGDTQSGYKIDFSASTASIIDSTPPAFAGIVSATSCGMDALTFRFSENVLCAAMTSEENLMTLVSPTQEIHQVTSVWSDVCGQYAEGFANMFTLTLDPPLTWNGEYTLKLTFPVKDACDNASPTEFNFTINVIDASAGPDQAYCSGGTGVSLAATGPSDATYLWAPSGGLSDPSVLNPIATPAFTTTYTLVVTQGDCLAVDSTTVSVYPALTLNTFVQDVSTQGGSDGGIVAEGAGGAGAAFEYSLNGVDFTGNGIFSNLFAGEYIVYVRDPNGCVTNKAVVVNQPQTGCTLNITDVLLGAAPLCWNSLDGAIQIIATGEQGNIMYSIDNGENFQSLNKFSGLAGGVYQIVVIDDAQCTDTLNYELAAPQPLVFEVIVQNTSGPGQQNGQLTFTNVSGGTPDYHYYIDAQETFTPVITQVQAGTYVLSIIDGQGCETKDTVTVLDGDGCALQMVLNEVTNVNCFGDATGAVSVSAIGGVGPYLFQLDGGQPQSGDNALFTDLVAGDHLLVISDAGTCVDSFIVQITENAAIEATPIVTGTTGGLDNGVINVSATGGQPPYTYVLDGLPPLPFGFWGSLAAGDHALSITDALGCTLTMVVNVPAGGCGLELSLIPTAAACYGETTGMVTCVPGNAQGSVQFDFNGSGFQDNGMIMGLAAGTYYVVAKDSAGCLDTAWVDITQPDEITWTLDVIHPTTGNNDGQITINAIGGVTPYTYSLDGQVYQPENVFSGLVANAYVIYVQDASGCVKMGEYTLDPQSNCTLAVEVFPTNVICYGDSTGLFDVSVTGGQTPYEYSIDGANYQTDAAFTNLASGAYTLYVRDAAGCADTSITLIQQPDMLIATVNTLAISAPGANDGKIAIIGAGGTPGYAYSNDGVNFTSSADAVFYEGLAPGAYTVYVKDTMGCIADSTVTFTDPVDCPGVELSLNVTNAPCFGMTGGLDATLLNANGPVQYWLNNGTPQDNGTFTNLAATTYTVTARDSIGCERTLNVGVNQPDDVSFVVSPVNASTQTATDGSLTVSNPSGGVGAPYTYSIDGVNYVSDPVFAGLAVGIYNVCVQDQNGCKRCLAYEVSYNVDCATLSATLTVSYVSCNGGEDGIVFVETTTGGSGDYSYSLNDGAAQSSPQFLGLSQGPQKVTVYDNGTNCVFQVSGYVSAYDSIYYQLSQSAASGGLSNGFIFVTNVGGGLAPYEYSADGGANFQSSPTFSGLSSGNYSVYVRDANGCLAPNNITVDEVGGCSLSLTANVSQVTCWGASDGAITLVPLNGSNPYVYSMNGGGFSPQSVYSSLSPGEYTFVVADNLNCFDTLVVTLAEPTQVSVAIASQTPVTTNGGTDGSVTVNASGGTAPYQYSIDGVNFSPNNTLSGLSATQYFVTARDVKGCTADVSVTIVTDTCGVFKLVPNVVQSACFGDPNSVKLNAGGLPGPFLYSINNGGWTTTNLYNNLPDGLYTFAARANNGCIATAEVHIVVPDAPLVVSYEVKAYLTPGNIPGVITFDISGGIPPYSYSKNGDAFVQFSQETTIEPLDPGTYFIVVRDSNSCAKGFQITVNEIFCTMKGQISETSNLSLNCFGESTGSLTIDVTDGLEPYMLQLGAGEPTTVTTFDNLIAGEYVVYIEDVEGCADTVYATITQPDALQLSATATPVVQVNPGRIEANAIGGVPPYQYALNGEYNDSNVFEGLEAGTYTVSVRDSNGCIDSETVEVTVYNCTTTIFASATGIPCFGQGGTATITLSGSGGPEPYLYSFQDGDWSTVTVYPGLDPNIYMAAVKDSMGCVDSTTVEILAPTPIVIYADVTGLSSAGASDGKVTLSVWGGNAPYEYALNGGDWQTDSVFTGLAAGTYPIAVRDAEGCTQSTVILIKGPLPCTSTLTLTPYNVSCFGENNGSIMAVLTFANPPVQYSLNSAPYQDSNIFSDLVKGTYTVTAKDAAGCVTTKVINVNQPSLIHIQNLLITAPSCNGGADGAFKVTAAGGVGGKRYSLTGANFTASGVFTGLTAGTYTLYIRDAYGCIVTESITLDAGAGSTLAIEMVEVVQPICNGATNGKVTITASGGTAPYRYSLDGQTYQWDNVLEGVMEGVYTVYVKDNVGCFVTQEVTVVSSGQSNLAIPQVNVTSPLCQNSNDGAIGVMASGGVGDLTYSIDNMPYQTSWNFPNLAAGLHNVRVRDAVGCWVTQNVDLTPLVNSNLAITNVEANNPTCAGVASGVLTVWISGGTAPFAYSIDGVSYQPSNVFDGLTAGEYTVYARDAMGCIIPQANALIPQIQTGVTIENIVATQPGCAGTNDGALEIIAGSGVPTVSYSLDGVNYQLPNTFTQLTAGTYTVYVKDGLGCMDSESFELVALSQTNLVLADVSIQNPTCLGNENGMLVVTAVGGVSPLMYSINGTDFVSDNVFAGLSGGAYTVTVRDANGCSRSEHVELTASAPSFDITNVVVTRPNCSGTTDGKIIVLTNVPNNTLEYSLNGENYQTDNVFVGVTAGTYTVYVRDAGGCVDVATVSVEPLNVPVEIANIDLALPSCDGSANGKITFILTNVNINVRYSIDGGQHFQLSSVFTNVAAGGYDLMVKDAVTGCIATEFVNVVPQPSDISLDASATATTCAGAATGSITVSASGAPIITYSLDGENYQSESMFDGLMAGDYVVYAKDGETNCYAMMVVTVPSGPTVVNFTGVSIISPACANAASGQIIATAVGGESLWFALNDGAYQASGMFSELSSGNYVLHVRNENGCGAMQAITLEAGAAAPSITLVTVTKTTCLGASDGEISLEAAGGTPGYEYSLNGEIYDVSASFTGLMAGEYMVYVRDANGCTATRTVSVESGAGLANITNVATIAPACAGASEWKIVVTANGSAIEYSLNGMDWQSDNTFMNLAAGTYTVYVRSEGCQSSQTVTLTETGTPLEITDVEYSPQLPCAESLNGFISVTATGGTAPYEYSIDNLNYVSTPDFAGLVPGYYVVFVRDANGCFVTAARLIASPTFITVTATKTDPNGEALGSIALETTGGLAPYMYSLEGGIAQSEPFFTNLSEGSYIITVSDANGCERIETVTLVEQSICTAPTGLTVSDVTANAANVTWTAVSGAQGYEVWYSNDLNGNVFTATTSGTSATITNLLPNTPYTVRVRTICASGAMSEYTADSASFMTLDGCTPPITLNVTIVTTSGAQVQWQAVPGAVGYQIAWRKDSPNAIWNTATVPSNVTTYQIMGLQPGTTYQLRGRTICANGVRSLWFNLPSNFTTLQSKEAQADAATQSRMSVYPNPNRGVFAIQYEAAAAGQAEIRMMDMSGRAVLNRTATLDEGVNEISIDMAAQAAGVYLLEVRDGQNVRTVKVIVQ